MTDRPVTAQPSPTTPSRGRRSPGRKVLVVTVAIVVVIGGFFFARALYWAALQPTPDFASLATTPDPSLTGTVAFLEPGDDRCVYVVAASGGEPEELACADGLAGELAWRDDGRLCGSSPTDAIDSIHVATHSLRPPHARMTAVLDASTDDSSRVEQPSTMPAGVSALGSLDNRRMTDELRDGTFRLAAPADQKVRLCSALPGLTWT